MASSCIHVIESGCDLIEQIPCRPGLRGRHGLDRVADMDENVVADRNVLAFEQAEADVARDAFGLAAGGMAVDADDLHRHSNTHSQRLVSFGVPQYSSF